MATRNLEKKESEKGQERVLIDEGKAPALGL